MLKRLMNFHRLHSDLADARRERDEVREKLLTVIAAVQHGTSLSPTLTALQEPSALSADIRSRLQFIRNGKRATGFETGYNAALPSGGVFDIAQERRRQVQEEGWTPLHDDAHDDGDLAFAASVYASYAAKSDSSRAVHASQRALPENWPWGERWFKPSSRRRDLVKAGALIAAEIDRLDRLEARQKREAKAATADARAASKGSI